MRLSRSLLFLVSALALPTFAASGCGDDSGDSDNKPSDEPSDDDNGGEVVVDGGKKPDAGGSKMDATVTPGSGDSGSDTKNDAGETTADSGSTAIDSGAVTDAAAEGIDASKDASTDAATTDADAGKADAKVDAGDQPEEDAGNQPEEDAGNQPEEDAGNDAGTADSGSTDAGNDPTPDPITEADCEDGMGELKDDTEQCADGQITYPVIGGDKICCGPGEMQPGDGKCGGIAGTACGAGEFCDKSTAAGGDGCVADAQGECKPIPADCAPFEPVCGCNGVFYVTSCQAYLGNATIKSGDTSCFPFTLPTP